MALLPFKQSSTKMNMTLETDLTTVDGLLGRLEQLNDIGMSLSKERDITRLLERILVAAKTLTHADGGTVYSMLADGRTLRFEILRTDSLNIAMGGSASEAIRFPDLSLTSATGTPNDSLVAAYAAIHRVTVNIEDAYIEPNFDFSGTRLFDKKTGYRSKSFLTVPMCDHEGDVIGVLQLINAQQPGTSRVVSFSAADQQLTESLASQAAIALSNRRLLTQLEDLFESFIGMINMAIDEKSHYTGGHCERVPALTMMLAEAVAQTRDGPLASFNLNDFERYELKIAGLLHDCGKVTTPVHVVDKSTKLETIFDRIHLIDTRFEVLKRDVEIGVLKGDITQDDAKVRLAELESDREFLRRANVGGEFMKEDDITRVTRIAAYRWQDVSGVETSFLSDEELKNLTIRAGTLTGEERAVINHHIVATIKMLEALPWPKHLKNVPE
jgi:hypothetical protein